MTTPDIEFAVTGRPIPQPRHRFRKLGGPYIPATHAIHGWKAAIRIVAEVHRPEPIIDYPVAVSLAFFVPRPKSHYRSGKFSGVLRDAAPNIICEHRNDLDNYIKGVLDALTSILWVDDGLVNRLESWKHYAGSVSRVEVSVKKA